jgi:hypothetical protein
MKNFWNSRRANFNLRFLIYVTPFLLLSMLLVSQSCKKDNLSSIGLDLKDDLLNAVFTDTVTLTAYSVEEDTLNTTGLVFNYLGCIKDNIFGTTTASIFAQLVPNGNNVSFGDAQECDSIVLTLRYTGNFYGDTLNPFSIKVYRLTEDIVANKIYYQNSSIAYNSSNLTSSDFILYPKPNTKVKVDTLLNAHIRIRLKKELGDNFIQDAKKDSLASAEVFKKYFKGLYISAEPFRNDGSLVNFTLTNALSGIQLYYKKDGKATQFSFLFTDKDLAPIRFSNYRHDYGAGNPKFVDQIDTLKPVKDRETLGKTELYAQSMGGIKTKITFPYIKEFKNKRVVINKAELIITNIGEDLHLYPNPNRLGIQGVNSSGKLVTMPDAVTGNANYFGGSYDEKTKEYRFRITRYLQGVIQRDDYQPYIYLVTEGAAAYATRLVLKGTDVNAPSRLRLEVYYTEY